MTATDSIPSIVARARPRPTARGDRVASAWIRLAPAGLAVLAGVLYLVNLDVSGYANTYYSAAAQAAGQSVSAWFFGAFDGAGFITVDKPPVSLWAMGLSVRLLGLSPFAILLPQAVAGVASVVLLYVAVRRQFGTAAAVIAGVAFAVTPVAALVFRYNNPDAVLVLLLVAAACALVRGLEAGRIRWAVLAGVLVGFAFLTKYLQAYLVLPAFALTWLVAAPGSLGRRTAGLVASAVAVAGSSLWWVAIVELLPPDARPFIGGSTTNSAVELLLGYDGLGRIFGGGGAGPGGRGAGGFGGSPGLLRMFNPEWAGGISWLLPASAIALVGGLVVRARRPRTDLRRAGYLLWGTWAIVHVLVFSLMSGIVHSYYAAAIAPAAAALFGAGTMELWGLRGRHRSAGLVIAAMLVVTAAWAFQVLERTPDFYPGVGVAAVFLALAAGLVVAVPPVAGDARSRAAGRAALALGVAAVLVGPSLYTVTTMQSAIAGGDPAAGPTTDANGFGGFGRGFRGDAGGASDALIAYLVANRGDAT